MTSASAAVTRAPGRRLIDRLVAGFLILLMAAGSLWLWMGVPVMVLWGIAQLVDSPAEHATLGLVGVPAGMILFVPLLIWINRLYLRVTGAYSRAEQEEDADEAALRLRGPLDLLLVWSLLVALVALVLWLVFGAEGPGPRQVI